jgi:hypothetical protein
MIQTTIFGSRTHVNDNLITCHQTNWPIMMGKEKKIHENTFEFLLLVFLFTPESIIH